MFLRLRSHDIKILKMIENVTIAKFRPGFTPNRHNLKMMKNLAVSNPRCNLSNNFMPKKCTYTFRTIKLFFNAFQNVLFSLFSRVHRMPFSNCASQSYICNVYRFPRSSGKNMLFLREQKAYPSHFTQFSDCACKGPASCERNLN